MSETPQAGSQAVGKLTQAGCLGWCVVALVIRYISRCDPSQSDIYYLCAPNRELALASPYYEVRPTDRPYGQPASQPLCLPPWPPSLAG